MRLESPENYTLLPLGRICSPSRACSGRREFQLRLQPGSPWSDHVSLWLGSFLRERFYRLDPSRALTAQPQRAWVIMGSYSALPIIERIPGSIDYFGDVSYCSTGLLALE